MRVLLVDDDEIHLLILRRIFEKSMDFVEVAHNGIEALKILELNPSFQVILTDIMMPEMDGIELLVNLKNSEASHSIPVIGFTSGDVEYYRKSTPVQFDSLVSKPMDFWDLYHLAKLKASSPMN